MDAWADVEWLEKALPGASVTLALLISVGLLLVRQAQKLYSLNSVKDLEVRESSCRGILRIGAGSVLDLTASRGQLSQKQWPHKTQWSLFAWTYGPSLHSDYYYQQMSEYLHKNGGLLTQ